MPLLNSMGSLRNMGIGNYTVTPISNQEWIAQFSDDNSRTQAMVTSDGDIFLLSPSSAGIIKINSAGAKVFAYSTNDIGNSSGLLGCLDSSNNVYVAGYDTNSISPPVGPFIIKYSPTGTILWQQYYIPTTGPNSANDPISLVIAPTGDLFLITGNSNGGTPVGAIQPYVVFRIDSNTGAIINQRKVLKQASSAPSDLCVDTINNKLYISGTDYSTTYSTILLGTYNFTNTDTASAIAIQSSTTDNYETFFGGVGNNNLVTDGTYVYMTANRIYSGISRNVYMKINPTTGAVLYSYSLVTPSNNQNLRNLTIDDSGHIYVIANSTGGLEPFSTITKINCSDGSIVWAKTMGSASTFEGIDDIVWSAGFLYFSASFYTNDTGTWHNENCLVKMKDDGSLPNGTYGTYWTFGSSVATTLSRPPDTTGTTTGSNGTSTYTASTASYTTSVDPVTISTINIP